MYKLRKSREKRLKLEFTSVSIPKPVLEEVDDLIRKLGYWPSRSSFVREATVEKIHRERSKG